MTTQEVLSFQCPHCSHRSEDSLEVLDAMERHEMHCEACRGSYWIVIVECNSCAHEQVLISTSRPAELVPADQMCAACGQRLAEPDDDPETQP